MIQVEDREAIRRAYFDEHKSNRTIAIELGHGRDPVAAALVAAPVFPQYTLTVPRAAPKLAPPRVRKSDALLFGQFAGGSDECGLLVFGVFLELGVLGVANFHYTGEGGGALGECSTPLEIGCPKAT